MVPQFPATSQVEALSECHIDLTVFNTARDAAGTAVVT